MRSAASSERCCVSGEAELTLRLCWGVAMDGWRILETGSPWYLSIVLGCVVTVQFGSSIGLVLSAGSSPLARLSLMRLAA